MYVSIGEAALILGISPSTLRRWEKEGKVSPGFRTPGGHRRYLLSDRRQALGFGGSQSPRITVAYARVSSHDQKEDLQRQVDRLTEICSAKGDDFLVIRDLGSGMNYRKRGLNRLIGLILSGQVEEIVLTHKDRLLRFGYELIARICDLCGTRVILVETEEAKSPEESLVRDVLEILTVFSARLYGRRSRTSVKKVA